MQITTVGEGGGVVDAGRDDSIAGVAVVRPVRLAEIARVVNPVVWPK